MTEEIADAKKMLSRYIVEIRFKPDGRLFDRRGQVAEILVAGDNLFESWSIGNRVDLSSKENTKITAFFSHRNFGVTSHYPNDAAFFKEQARKFIRLAWNQVNSGTFLRLGIRSTFIMEMGDFDSTVDGYIRKFLKLDDDDLKQIGGELIDVGFPLNFASGDDLFNVMTGPMKIAQAQQFLRELRPEHFPDVGLYLDVDYFRTRSVAGRKQQAVYDFMDRGMAKAESILDTVHNWVIGAC